MIRDDGWREKAGELETAVAVRRAHHCNLNALIGESGDTSRPFTFDRGPPFELQAELNTAVQQMQRRDTEGVLSHVSEQYRTGPFTKAGLRRQLQTMFALYDTLTVRVRIDTVRMLGDQAWVYSTGEVNGRLQWVGRWVPVLSWQRQLEVARRENGVWRVIGDQQ